MNNNKFYNYDNNIEVLNEGFFDFVWKWTNRIFHSLFKVNDFSSLYKRVGQIEDIIKYGKVIKESNNFENVSNKLNEGRSRTRRVVEDDADTSTNQNIIEDPDEVDLDDRQNNKTIVNMDKVDMNVPSFPQVAKQLLKGLELQIKQNKEKLSPKKIEEDLSKVESGIQLSQRYVQRLEILVTDFIRKYSAGKLTLPKPSKDRKMSYKELAEWQKYSQSAVQQSSKMFLYVHETMEKIVDDYEKAFNKQYQDLKDNEESFINKYKNGEKSKTDRNFLTEWDNKISKKISDVKRECIEFIPTAIANYFINDKIYKEATDYIQSALNLLIANSKNMASNDNEKNTIIEYLRDWKNKEKSNIVQIINEEKNNLLDVIKGNNKYVDLEKSLNNINDNTINRAMIAINNIKNINKIKDDDLIMLTSEDINNATENTDLSIIIALLIHHIDARFEFELKNIGNINIFDLLENNGINTKSDKEGEDTKEENIKQEKTKQEATKQENIKQATKQEDIKRDNIETRSENKNTFIGETLYGEYNPADNGFEHEWLTNAPKDSSQVKITTTSKNTAQYTLMPNLSYSQIAIIYNACNVVKGHISNYSSYKVIKPGSLIFDEKTGIWKVDEPLQLELIR